tara:strand:- start:280 stop:468 length:189 start_codon:yes stop_codon:yes gene_type:complete
MNFDAANRAGVCGFENPTFSKFKGTLSTQIVQGMVHKIPINVVANLSLFLGVGDFGKDIDQT